MVYCAAFGCKNRSEKKIPGITFHRFPKDPRRRLAWTKAVRRKYWTPNKSSVVCSEHFQPEDFDRTSLSYVRVREHSVPSVFPGFPSYLTRAAHSSCCKQKGQRKVFLEYDDLQDQPEETKPTVADLQVQVEESLLPGKSSSEYVLPENDLNCSSNDACTENFVVKNEPHIPDEANSEYSQTESEPINRTCNEYFFVVKTEPYIPDEAGSEYSKAASESVNRTCNKYYELQSDIGLSKNADEDHMYTDATCLPLLKQKLDSVYSHLNHVNKKLKIEREKYRQAKKTISKLKRIINQLKGNYIIKRRKSRK